MNCLEHAQRRVHQIDNVGRAGARGLRCGAFTQRQQECVHEIQLASSLAGIVARQLVEDRGELPSDGLGENVRTPLAERQHLGDGRIKPRGKGLRDQQVVKTIVHRHAVC